MKKLVLSSIRLYQLTLSYVLGPRCRFYPTCSQYGLTAIEEYGLIKGTAMVMRRIAKCHPFNPGGYDPVPERFDANNVEETT